MVSLETSAAAASACFHAADLILAAKGVIINFTRM
jgi:hypothetical protein